MTLNIETYDCELPVMIETGKNKKVKRYLNLNGYRNWPYHLHSDLKNLFQPVRPPQPFKAEKIRISYQYIRCDKRRVDLMNVISVVDKYFLDWLVSAEYIPDDTIYNIEYGAIRPIITPGEGKTRVRAIITILK